MSDFINMGYAVICDNCDRRHNFPQSGNVNELRKDMATSGLFSKSSKHYCNEKCYLESTGKICLHVYSRDNDRNCIKCGEPEVLICQQCGKPGSVFCSQTCEDTFYKES